jgi:hypothetical protein
VEQQRDNPLARQRPSLLERPQHQESRATTAHEQQRPSLHDSPLPEDVASDDHRLLPTKLARTTAAVLTTLHAPQESIKRKEAENRALFESQSEEPLAEEEAAVARRAEWELREDKEEQQKLARQQQQQQQQQQEEDGEGKEGQETQHDDAAEEQRDDEPQQQLQPRDLVGGAIPPLTNARPSLAAGQMQQSESQMTDFGQEIARLRSEVEALRKERETLVASAALQSQRLSSRRPNTTCTEFLNTQQSFANFSQGITRVAHAWAASQTGRSSQGATKHTYCFSRCALLRCCPGQSATIRVVHDSIQLGVEVTSVDDHMPRVREAQSPSMPMLQKGHGDVEQTQSESQDESAPSSRDEAPNRAALAGALDITLVTHGTLDRLAAFAVIDAVWPGPKVAVFVVPALGKNSTAEEALVTLRAATQQWTNVRVVLCTLTATSDFFTKRMGSATPEIPINTLRNVGVDYAPTNYVFPLDMDFIPSRRLYAKLRRTYLPLLAHVDRAAVVLPHWETLKCTKTPLVSKKAVAAETPAHRAQTLPLTFNELDKQVRAGRAQPFHVRTDMVIPATLIGAVAAAADCAHDTDDWLAGVQASNYPRWYRDSLSQRDGVVPLPLAVRPHMLRNYEPFVIVRQVEADGTRLPRYQEEFVGRYKNKVAWVTTLRAHRYQFQLMLGEFVLHLPHPVRDQSTPNMQRHFHTMERLFWREQGHLTRNVIAPSGKHFPGFPNPSPFPRGFVCSSDGAEDDK